MQQGLQLVGHIEKVLERRFSTAIGALAPDAIHASMHNDVGIFFAIDTNVGSAECSVSYNLKFKPIGAFA